MAYTIWNSVFEGKPDGSDDPSLGDDEIRDFKTLARGILAKEHHLVPATDTEALQGWHNEGSAVAYYQADAPTQRPDESTSLDTGDGGRIWVDSDDGKLYVWTGAAWDALTPGATVSDELADLTAAEIQQLQNIGSESISAAEWGHVAAMNQDVGTGNAVTFATVNTGHGNNELHGMNQSVKTTDDVEFSGITGDHLELGGESRYSTYDLTAGTANIDTIRCGTVSAMSRLLFNVESQRATSDSWTNWFAPSSNSMYLVAGVGSSAVGGLWLARSGLLIPLGGSGTAAILRLNGSMLQVKDNGESYVEFRATVIGYW